MIKLIFEQPAKSKNIADVDIATPIFVKRNGKFIGSVILNPYLKPHHGWIINLGGSSGATGYHDTREECIKSASQYDYEFFIEE